MTSNRQRALGVIERAIEENRLTHALLLKGRSPALLQQTAEKVAAQLLHCESGGVSEHPDFFRLQAKNRMRRISVEDTRELIRNIQHSPSAGDRKVALVHEVDLMNKEAANAFLKTLEEPPLNTRLILTTARPYALLDTIVSRCVSFWFHEPLEPIEDASWQEWKQRFRNWFSDLLQPPSARVEVSDRVYQLYGLLEGFKSIQDRLSDSRWEAEKARLPSSMTEEHVIAMEVGFVKGVRNQLLMELEENVRVICAEKLHAGNPDSNGAFSFKYEQSVQELESLKGLLEVNMTESRLLEVYFLRLLRIWSQPV